jgi:hypothetical protein
VLGVQTVDQTLNMKLKHSQQYQCLFSPHLSQQGPLKEHIYYHKAENKFMKKKLEQIYKMGVYASITGN